MKRNNKMRASALVIFLMVIGMVSCRHSSCDPKDIEKENLANKVLRESAIKIKQETGLRPCGDMGQMLYQVEKLGLSFQYYKPTDIVEGRKLLIQAIDRLMEEVNQEKKIHPFLSKYPFKPHNIDIRIFLYEPDGKNVPVGALSVIGAQDGVLHYKIDDPRAPGFIRVYKETYDQALERLKDPSLPLVHYDPPPEISQKELERLRKNIGFVSDDGSIWHLDKEGRWTKDSK